MDGREFQVGGVPLTVVNPAAAPDGGPDAGLVVIQDAFGVGATLTAGLRRFAADGYLTVAPHLYHRVAAEPVDTFDAAKPLMRSLNGPDITRDIAAAIGYLDGAGIAPHRRGVVGFCMGGTISLWQAAAGEFAAAVTFYGGGVTKRRWKGVPTGLVAGELLTCPWLGLYGDKDRSIRPAEVEQLREITTAGREITDIVRYPDAGHAFALDPAAPNYVAEAAADAWARALSWFDAHLRG